MANEEICPKCGTKMEYCTGNTGDFGANFCRTIKHETGGAECCMNQIPQLKEQIANLTIKLEEETIRSDEWEKAAIASDDRHRIAQERAEKAEKERDDLILYVLIRSVNDCGDWPLSDQEVLTKAYTSLINANQSHHIPWLQNLVARMSKML